LLALLSFITSSTVSCRTAASTTASQNIEELEALHHSRSNQNTEQRGVLIFNYAKTYHNTKHPAAMHHATTTYQKAEELFAPHCTKNPIYVFLKRELRSLSPNSYILGL
jgi:hypothetical protein